MSDAGTFTCTAYYDFGKPENRTVSVNVTWEYAFIQKYFDQC